MSFRVLTRAAGLIALAAVLTTGLTTEGGCDGCSGGGFDAGGPDLGAAVGRFSLSWSVIDQASSQPVNCDQLDLNATVFVEAVREGTGAVESFACRNLQGTSMTPLFAGTYSFSYALRVGGATIATASGPSGVVIGPGQQVQLAPITFQVDASGGLALQLRAGAAGNCAGGATITGFSLSLQHAGGPGDTGCAPVVFTLSGGGTYNASDCSAPAVTRCIVADETLSVASLPAGTYQIHVRGKKGALDCWVNDDVLRVPPQSALLSETLNLALQSETPGCQ
ncbi:MAG TPA: hypothetical protein VHT91_24585 [Kofleriaceae bacterium]|jgi:hypothetical protein|nr:hypothetical protein [Kofleriaceae bacterium]